MGQQAPDKKNLTVQTSKDRHAYIAERGARINLSISEFFRPWVDKWFDEGCPNLHDLEDRLPVLAYSEDGVELTKKRRKS